MMNKEIEAKFINIKKEQVIKKLRLLGAKEVFKERLYKRGIFMFGEERPNTWIRVRDEGDIVTMTYKRVIEKSLQGVEEVELEIDNFESGIEFLRAIHLNEKAYQESKRIRYTIAKENVVFDIDTWPGLNPLLEIEADDEQTITKYTELLGFCWSDALFGSIDFVYEKVFKLPSGWIFNSCPRLEFGNLPPEISS